jgi:hypothetical protein
MNPELMKKFLTSTDETGRFIVSSPRTGKTYAVEPIDNRSKTDWTEWGSIDPASGKMMNKPGFRKYAGAIDEKDSLITEDNGFKNIKMLEPGDSPLAVIDMIDSGYPDK